MYLIAILAFALLAWALHLSRCDLARERKERRALAAGVHMLDQRVHALETREAHGGPLSSARPPLPTLPPSQSGVRERATIGAPQEELTVVMQRGVG